MRSRSQLSTACERALIEAARGSPGGTRQQIRAAARRFVRRHRRDADYLRWVARSAGASSALALALLGLGAEPAQAKATLFTPLTGAANPLDGQAVVGLSSTPTFGDLDGDGDRDLVAGERDGGFAYFENTGSAITAGFAARTGAQNPLDGDDVGLLSTPALGDLDADGDLDLVAGEKQGGFHYFENTGSATVPEFVARTGAGNPLSGLAVAYASAPTFCDLDGDGDLDLASGDYDGTLRYFENTGTATSPAFVARTGAANPLSGHDVGYYATPALGDLDFDGDPDLVAGNLDGEIAYFENTGSATTPAFAARTAMANPLNGADVGSSAAPALTDLDADGDLDLVVGETAANFHAFANRMGKAVVMVDSPLSVLGFSLEGMRLAFGDLDGDGDLDLVAGLYYASGFRYYENTGSASNMALVQRTGAANPFDALEVPSASPTLGDLDGDGDLDLVSGSTYDGHDFYFENTGGPTSPAFVARPNAPSPLNDTYGGVSPCLADLDRDGDLDIVSGRADGRFRYWENTGSTSSPAFVQRTGAANPLDALDINYWSNCALGDLDGDGDLDFVGHGYGTGLRYYENTGSATSPVFVARTGAADPLGVHFAGFDNGVAIADLDGDGDLDLTPGGYYGYSNALENTIFRPSWPTRFRTHPIDPLAGVAAGSLARPALGDLDGDGDRELLVGESDGGFLYYENTGSVENPLFAPRTGAANPLDGQDIGAMSGPALGDLDGDGDLDLVAGESFGPFFYFENTGSAIAAAFAPRSGAQNPFSGLGPGFGSAPALADLDRDGDLDLVAGNANGRFAYFENTGDSTAPAFVARTGAQNPLDGQDVGDHAAPSFADLDRDGDLDLVAGIQPGTFSVFENTGTATAAAFVARTGAANPLAGQDLGSYSAPALGDLDADGDADLVAGESSGTFRTYYDLPEPGQSAVLAAGVALLSLLARLRRRSVGASSALAASLLGFGVQPTISALHADRCGSRTRAGTPARARPSRARSS